MIPPSILSCLAGRIRLRALSPQLVASAAVIQFTWPKTSSCLPLAPQYTRGYLGRQAPRNVKTRVGLRTSLQTSCFSIFRIGRITGNCDMKHAPGPDGATPTTRSMVVPG